MGSLNQLTAKVLGVVLLVVGIVGFVWNPILFFSVNMLHNIVHVVSGAAGAWAGWTSASYARLYNKIFGVVYLLVAVLGFFGLLGGLLAINGPDNWLHLVIGLAVTYVGFWGKD